MEEKNRVLIETERKLLAVSIFDSSTVPETAEFIRSEDFIYEKHKYIYQAIMSLLENGKDINTETISTWLAKRDMLKISGGIEYLAKLNNYYQGRERIGDIRKIVFEASRSREFVGTLRDTFEQIDKTDDLQELIFNLQANLSTFNFEYANETVKSVGEIGKSINDEIINLQSNPKSADTLSSGFESLDKVTGLFESKKLVIIGGRSSMGKTCVTNNLALNMAKQLKERNKNESVLIFSLEMSKESLVRRMLSTISTVPGGKLRNGHPLTRDEWTKLNKAQEILRGLNIFIDDTSGLNIAEIRSRLLKMKREHNVRAVFIDYAGLISHNGLSTKSEYEGLSKVVVALKNLAKELDVTLFLLSQLNRNVENRISHVPQLSDLANSGVMEAAADIVMLLYRESYYQPQEERKEIDNLSIIIAKNRDYSVGRVELNMFMSQGKLTDKYEWQNKVN